MLKKFTIAILVITSFSNNAFAKPDFVESKRRWLNECGTSLYIALREFGPKKDSSYRNDNEKWNYIKEVCMKDVDANVKRAMTSKLSLEEHACSQVVMMGDVVRSFNNKGSSDNSLDFGLSRCQNMDQIIAKRNQSK